MKRYAFLMLILIISLCYVCATASAITVTLKQNFSADKYPEGGHPTDKSHYNKFSFTLTITGLQTNEYYDIGVTLTSTAYTGYAANFGDTTESDLKFHRDDYPTSTTPQWTINNIGQMAYSIGTDSTSREIPSLITVRCYDWGASGTVRVTVAVRGSNSMPYTAAKSIPVDENENGIADGWEDMTQSYEVVVNGIEKKRNGYDPTADDEKGPANNNNDGDGWSVYDEYRGIFTTDTDTQVTRLDPKKKDVMVCSDEYMAEYGTGNTPSFDNHSFWTLEPAFVKDPWGQSIPNTNKSDRHRVDPLRNTQRY